MREPITGGEAILSALIDKGVNTTFGIPGIQTYPFFDAIAKHSEHIRHYTPRHEQSAAYMATGYAKSTGKPGVYSVVPGPGILNAGAAISTAKATNTPTLLVTGQVPSSYLGVGRGHLHELDDQLATLKGITKWSGRIDDAASAAPKVNEAYAHMTTGRQGPVALEMCWDAMMTANRVDLTPSPTPHTILEKQPPLNLDAVKEAAALLSTASNPMIMVGGGAQHAHESVLELATLLDAPVTAFRSGRGIVSEDHPLGVSSAAAYELWPETDVLIGIGSRLELQYMRWTGMGAYQSQAEAPPHLIRIDIDPSEIDRLEPHVGIVADSQEATNALLEALIQRGFQSKGHQERITNAKAKVQKQIEKIQPQMAYLKVIREVLPRDGFFIKDLCQIGYTSYFGFPVYEPLTYITSGYQGTLGFAFPTALGVKAGNPSRAVVAVVGDGGFMFGIQELATAAQENIALVTLVFNNGGYGNIRRDQQRLFENRVVGADLTAPDFVMLAESFGVRAHRVSTPDALKPVLSSAIDSQLPAVIEIQVRKGEEISPWEFIVRNPAAASDGLKIV
ncbi:MAG: thiamine pyrophosphate-dependent enzyme [Halioglobus sp.]